MISGTGWEQRVEQFWSSADDTRPAATLQAMLEIIGDRDGADELALEDDTGH